MEIEACLLIKTEEAGALQADERVMNINEEADLCSLTWSFRRLMHTILELRVSNIWLGNQQPVSKSATE